MGWKGTVRSIGAAARRMEKDAERRHKLALKEQIAMDASEAVANWENYIDDLLNVHTDLTDHIDWNGLLNKKKPAEPKPNTDNFDKAKADLTHFKPKFFDFLKGGTDKVRKHLDDAFEQAPKKDMINQQQALEKYNSDLTEWENDRDLAKRLSIGESLAIQEVITELQTLTKTDLIGSVVNFSIEDNYVHAKPQVHTDEIIPNFRRKQLASGKLSETKMPAAQFNELYQDYVASVALKVAGDLFQLLPLDEVYVTCESEMLNTATGHKEALPILSVKFVRETFMQLKLTDIDPSDSMGNFNHVMSFRRTKGFTAIVPFGKE